jgi:predicted metalloprotease with PDZ domain
MCHGISRASDAGPERMAPIPVIPSPQDKPYPGAIRLEVDASDVDRRIVRVKEHISGIGAGTVLQFPKWLPGNHSTTGPIDRLSGLHIAADGQPVNWSRDSVDMYSFHLDPPPGISEVDVTFDYLSPTSEKVDPLEMSREIKVLDWITLFVYPAGYFTRQIPVTASLKIPEGWQLATALERTASADGVTTFERTSIETLADSPVYAGRYARALDLDPGAKARVTLNLFADRPEMLAVTPAQLDAHRALVQQADRLYASRHYRHYDFLYALSDELPGKGLEHHESSEDTTDASLFTDWDKTAHERDLLPHEYTHSWNGKFRRPADLWTPSYNVPMQTSLLWVYEGQTEYWGKVLAARSGLHTRQQALDELALIAAHYDMQTGRQWRSLQDTTNEPIINHHRPKPWRDWTRAKEYYDEAALVWLDADTLIRERSKGRRSLDDFARAFFSIEDGSMAVSTYTFEDVVKALDAVEPYDWAQFLRKRLDAVGGPAPLDGLARGGYRLVYTEQPSEFQKHSDAKSKETDLTHSVGMVINEKNGSLVNVRWDSAAFKAGLTESTQLIAVNGTAYEADVLLQAIRDAKASKAPIELIVKAGDRYRVVRLDYVDGLRYPHLQRDAAVPARLDDILTARTR